MKRVDTVPDAHDIVRRPAKDEHGNDDERHFDCFDARPSESADRHPADPVLVAAASCRIKDSFS